MNIKGLFFFVTIVALLACKTKGNNDIVKSLHNPKKVHTESFQRLIDSAQVQGAILIYDLQESTYYSNDFDWAKIGRLPASTFKIPNSIIALEAGVVKADTTLLKWDGNKRAMEIWEKDLSLGEAFKRSCVPCYQELARKIGDQKMRENLTKLNFGAMQIDNSNLHSFWLEGASKINQFEQIEFLSRFYNSELPISEDTYKVMKRMMHMDSTEPFRISGKTGLSIRDGNTNGWFVGYFGYGTKHFFFATNIDPKETLDATTFNKARISLTVQAFKKLKLLSKRNLNFDNRSVSQ